jgi:RecB family exonuclease
VVCTWSTIARGRPVAPSPFVSRLALSGRAHEIKAPAAWRPLDPADGGGPVSALEHSVARAEAAGTDHLTPFFAAALAEGRELCGGASGVPVPDLAAARSAVIVRAEDPPPFESPGPWSGLVGPGVVGGDRDAWVTTFERTATCPWQRFVTHRLGVMPMPDPGDGLPDVDPQLVGNVAHQVLQRIVDEALGERVETLGRAVTRSPQTVRWPLDRDLDRMLAEAADRAVRTEGLAVYRLAPLVAARAREILQTARTVAWGDDGRLDGVIGAELVGELDLDEPQLTIRFRADRADATRDGLVLVDYKTGKPASDKKNADGRAADLAGRVARGRLLQAVAYALAVAGEHHDGTGRYLYLRPEIGSAPDEAREAAIRSDDAAVTASFRESVAAVREAQQAGAMFPRVEEADKPSQQPIHCSYCPVKEACRRDDSTFRRRLVEWMGDAGVTPDATGLAARRLWWLGVADD